MGPSIHLEPVAITSASLDPRFVFILDTGIKIYLWNGKKAANILVSKARLLCEKINKNERKNKAEIITEIVKTESKEFWMELGESDEEKPEQSPTVSSKVVFRYKYLNLNEITMTNTSTDFHIIQFSGTLTFAVLFFSFEKLH